MRICCTMIVKNEAHVLRRCLESVLPLVDCFCVCDTGSTDNTESVFWDVVESQAVEADFVHHAWENFGANRTQAFRAAERLHKLGRDDWHLVIDADDALQLSAKRGIRTALETMEHDCWSLEVHQQGMRFHRLHFFRADGTWTYKGPAHEHPHRTQGEANKGEFHPEAIFYRFIGGGATHLVPQAEKFAGHAELFREALAANPEDTRSAFYLAQSLKDAGQIPEAIQAYLKRASMGGWDQEAYYSLLQAGRLLRQEGSTELAQEWLLAAHLLDPTRAEAPFEMAAILAAPCREWDDRAKEHEAYLWAELAATRPEPSKDHLFVEPDVWTWSRNLAAQLRAKLCG